MLARVRLFLEMIKFSHTVFALPFAILAACLAAHRAGGWRTLDLVGILLGMVFARSAAMGFNRWADQRFDAANPRTAGRHIPAGLLGSGQVLLFTIVCALAFQASTLLFVASSGNRWPAILAMPVLLVLLGYSLTKRFTSFAHAWLGVALGLAPICAWLAIRGTLELPPVILGAAIVFWVTGFDILYACQDLDVDRRLGLRSIPAWLGMSGAMRVARGCHAVMLGLLAWFGTITPELGPVWWIGFGATALVIGIEHWLVRGRDLGRINLAFFHANAAVGATLLAATLADLYLIPRVVGG